MARRKKHHRKHLHGRRRRRYRGFGDLQSTLRKQTSVGSVLGGALIGLGVTAGLKVVISNVSGLQQSIPDFVQNNMILVGSVLGGVGAYYARRKKNPSAAEGNLFGALGAGAVAFSWAALQQANPTMFGDVVTLNLANGTVQRQMHGLLMQEQSPMFPPQYSGMIVGDRTSGFGGTIVPDDSAQRQGLWSSGFDSGDSEDPTEGFMT